MSDDASERTESPPIRPFGDDDRSIEAWSIALEPDSPSAAIRFASLLGSDGSDDPKPLLPPRDDLAIEVWTECELSVLHAAWRLVIAAKEASDDVEALKRRVVSAVAWHLERTQPDNATTHPWGVHVFLELGTPWLEASDYAASIIHASEAAAHASGMLDPLSGWILLDAAEGLERLENEKFGA